ncbi:MAG TPA: DUF302 domain-containing protein [Aquificaceae bacterium]|nr:DUF302 domain-containing protein [Aquificaceae bacterium]HIQ48840.1 DUF302 domain-containing protein [Aquifex aeolicus]
MKALIAFLIGVVVALSIFYFIRYYFGNPFRLMFYTVEIQNKDFDETLKELQERLNANGLKVIRILPLSKALEARGVKDFMNYSIVLACDIPEKEKLLSKVPSLINLIPCSITVYEDKEGVKLTAMKEIVFLAEESEKMSEEEIKLVIDTYRTLRKTLDEVRQ